MMIPKKLFFTKGGGVHKGRLTSFELALREACVEKHNLVSVSSILPPNCRIIPKEYGYLSVHHSFGEGAKKAGEYAEDLAATLLATTLGKNRFFI